jgi:hypothetical protein
MAKETYVLAKETYLYGKRDLFIWQKRPTYMAKETYLYGKRDLCPGKRNLLMTNRRTHKPYMRNCGPESDFRV